MNASEKTDCALVRWAPSRNSGVAIVTLLGMIAAYAILGANPDNPLILMLIGLVAVPVISVIIPVYWTTQVERQPILALGLTTRRWLPSILLSLALSLVIILPVYLSGIASEHNWLPMAAAGALSLFEPLFIFGWLQLRFEKDFGVLPADCPGRTELCSLSCRFYAGRHAGSALQCRPLDEFIEKYPNKRIRIAQGIAEITAVRLRTLNEDYFNLRTEKK